MDLRIVAQHVWTALEGFVAAQAYARDSSSARKACALG